MKIHESLAAFMDACRAISSPKEGWILYGAGVYGEETHAILTYSGIPMRAFCDGNPARVGGEFCGLPIIGVPQLCKLEKPLVLVTVMPASMGPICARLREAGLAEAYTVSLPELSLVELPGALEMILHKRSLAQTVLYIYQALWDERSKTAFVSWLYAVKSGNFSGLIPLWETVAQNAASPEIILSISGERFPDFLRQLQSADSVQVCWEVGEVRGLEEMAQLLDFGYQKLHILLLKGEMGTPGKIRCVGVRG